MENRQLVSVPARQPDSALIAPRTTPAQWAMPVAIGLLAGAAGGMDVLTSFPDPRKVGGGEMALYIGGGAMLLAMLLASLFGVTVRLVRRLDLDERARASFYRRDALTYLPALATFLGAAGVQFIAPVIAAIVLAFLSLKGIVLFGVLGRQQRQRMFSSLGYLAFLFLISGFAALIYQIVWQRTLFAAFGVNIESITIIVSLFMFGLGIGSMVGGILAARFPNCAATLFLSCEIGIGLFGIVSLPLIGVVARLTLHGAPWQVALAIFALLCIPTMFMGATLPILVNHLYRYYKNVGKSVGLLYCINTLGSAIACFITADLLFVVMGQQTAVLVAALCNMTVGILVSRYARRIAGK